MRRVLTCLVSLLVSTAALAADPPTRIELRIFDGNAPRKAVTVRVTHPDGERTSGATLELTTNDSGVVVFDLPATVFWVTVPELNDKVVGKEFRVSKGDGKIKHWDLRPREWPKEVGVSR